MNIADLPAVNRLLKRAYEKHEAPIVELVKAQTQDPFKILVATILSARTKDGTTADVVQRLFGVVRRPCDLRRLSQRRLEKLIFPIGFFRTKSRHLRQLPVVMDALFKGRIPDTIEDLCRLPGVGRKTANLVMTQAFDKHAICVDVHVHRISNRLGLLKTRTPLETEMTLRRILPRRYWKTWNSFLVSHGQRVCTPRGPHCDACGLRRHCARVGVIASRRAPRVKTGPCSRTSP
jgi:endonuclease III